MYQADDAVEARQRIEAAALAPYLGDRVEPYRFPKRTTLVVLVEFMPGTGVDEHLLFVVDCELWVDRNIFLRERGINTADAETATAYWDPEQKCFRVTGTKGSLCRTLIERLGLSRDT